MIEEAGAGEVEGVGAGAGEVVGSTMEGTSVVLVSLIGPPGTPAWWKKEAAEGSVRHARNYGGVVSIGMGWCCGSMEGSEEGKEGERKDVQFPVH